MKTKQFFCPIFFLITSVLLFAQENNESAIPELVGPPVDSIEDSINELDLDEDEEILFISNQNKVNPLFYTNLMSMGAISMGVGTVLGLATIPIAYFGAVAGDLESTTNYNEFRIYDYFTLASTLFIIGGGSAIYLGSTYSLTDGTVGGYKRWKRQQLATGLTSMGLGGVLIGTGVTLWGMNGYQDIEAPTGYTMGMGVASVLFGLPSFLVGLLGIF